MRHGRKSRSVLFDGYKRHVLRDLDTGLVPAVGITAANAPEASVTGAIAADLGAAGWHLSELHIDRAYLSSALVRDRGPDLAIYCKAWRVRNTGGRFAKDQFNIDLKGGTVSCPAGHTVALKPAGKGQLAQFGAVCADCPLAERCTTAKDGRTIYLGPYEQQLARARARQSDPAWKANYKATRPKVERKIAQLTRRKHGGRRARVRGKPKVKADLALLAAAVNLARLAVLGLHARHGGWQAQTA